MSATRSEVLPAAADWKREETRFLTRFMAPALAIQVGFLSYHSAAPVGILSAIVNLSPAVVLMAYLCRVLYRARRDGQFYPWGRHD